MSLSTRPLGPRGLPVKSGRFFVVGDPRSDRDVYSVERDRTGSIQTQGNPGWRRKVGDYGNGYFSLEKDEVHKYPSETVKIGRCIGGEPNLIGFDGCLHARGSFAPHTLPPIDDTELFGPAAFSGMRPTRPTFSGLEAIQGLPELVTGLEKKAAEFAHNFKSIKGWGKDYLSLQFEYGNLLSDIKGAINSSFNLNKQIRQLIRDNGKSVRRGITLTHDVAQPVSKIEQDYGAFEEIFVTQAYVHPPVMVTRIEETHKVWASCRMRYHLPDLPPVPLAINLGSQLTGFKPSFANLYKIVPWSWLVDWFTTVGPVLNNLQDSLDYRLATDYFYVMQERTYTETFNAWCTFYQYGTKDHISVSATTKRIQSLKNRVVGNPFGLSKNPEQLDDFQLSIMGSLGLSKLP